MILIEILEIKISLLFWILIFLIDILLHGWYWDEDLLKENNYNFVASSNIFENRN